MSQNACINLWTAFRRVYVSILLRLVRIRIDFCVVLVLFLREWTSIWITTTHHNFYRLMQIKRVNYAELIIHFSLHWQPTITSSHVKAAYQHSVCYFKDSHKEEHPLNVVENMQRNNESIRHENQWHPIFKKSMVVFFWHQHPEMFPIRERQLLCYFVALLKNSTRNKIVLPVSFW